MAYQQNLSGECMHEALIRLKLWAPTTMDQSSANVDPHTWHDSDGVGHRIDYPIVPLEWPAGSIQAHTPRGLDLTMERIDHTP
eukprot:437599-Alexandrium_andersonii.AAC.1